MKKLMAVVIAAGLTVSLAACAPAKDLAGNDCKETADVTFHGTIKPEIQDQFLAAVDDYNASQGCYKVTSLPSSKDTALAQYTTLYAAGNAPTIMTMLQELPDMADKAMDWTGTALEGLVADPNLLTRANIGGKQVGLPVTAEAFGLVYNKAVLDKAGVDPASIATRSDLEAAFKAVEATGVKAIHFSGLWWSLGAHLTNVYFTNTGKDHESRLTTLDKMAAGTLDLSKDPVFGNWASTFELMKAHDINGGKSIADSDYDAAVANLSAGKVGFWFMGNWSEPSLLGKDPEGAYGLMPLPISNNAADYGNDSISVGVPFYFVVDKEQSTEAERNGAIDFLTWLVTTEKGQTHYAGSITDNNMSFIPVYKNFTVAPSTKMATDIAGYISAGKTLEWINSYYPAGGQEKYGASAQKYITGKLDRAGFIKAFQADWKGAKASWR